jgi:hypothetical protein
MHLERRACVMVIERKIVVDLQDIRAVSFQCESCEYRVAMSPDKVSLPINCPNGHQWTSGQSNALIATPLFQFTSTLATLRTLLKQKALGYRIVFEFDEPTK